MSSTRRSSLSSSLATISASVSVSVSASASTSTSTTTTVVNDKAGENILTGCSNNNNITHYTRLSAILSKLNGIDELISGPVFRLSLPTWLELLYSFPSTIFGTSFSTTTMPLWIALLVSMEQKQQQQQQYIDIDNNRLLILKVITICSTAVYIISWVRFQQYGSYHLLMKLFYSSSLYQGGPFWCVATLAYTVLYNNNNNNSNNNTIFSMAIYPLFLRPAVTVAFNYLKKATKRHRPALKDFNGTLFSNSNVNDNANDNDNSNSTKWVEKKKYPSMSRVLAEYNGDASFPSGDAALATLYAIPIYHIGSLSSSSSSFSSYKYKALASIIIFLSASGRMYLLAHHLSDVTVGIIISYLIHFVATSVGFGMLQMKWWYPLLTNFIYFVFKTVQEKQQLFEKENEIKEK